MALPRVRLGRQRCASAGLDKRFTGFKRLKKGGPCCCVPVFLSLLQDLEMPDLERAACAAVFPISCSFCWTLNRPTR